jgi:hypothetical protein
MAQRQIARYSNGYVPVNRLIVIDRGYNGIDGNWEHRLPRATLRRWNRLVARAARRRAAAGLPPLALRITSGWCTDRPYPVQVRAKQIHGIYAATPGTSSHGGVFENKQTAAIDAGNYSSVYAGCGGYDAWLSDLRAEGFDRLPPGYPLDGERHHIIDYNPWDDEPEFGGAPAGGGATPFEKGFLMALTDKQQEDLYNNIAGNNEPFLKAIAQTVSEQILNHRVAAQGAAEGKTTTLASMLAWNDDHVESTPGRVWKHQVQAQDADGVPQYREDGSPVTFAAYGFAASTNAVVQALREVVATLALAQGADPAAIEAAAERGAQRALNGLVLRAE